MSVAGRDHAAIGEAIDAPARHRDASAWPDATGLAERLVQAAPGQVRVVILYGSRLLRASPDPYSAFDFVVIVEAYRPFYRALSAADELHRPVWLMSLLARVLPPNAIAFAPDEGRSGIAKCLVIDREDFTRALGDRPPDHFVLGRMVQKVGIVWSASEGDRAWVEARVSGARARVLGWMAPYLEGPVDAAGLGRRMLEVCYRGELRPEAKDRSDKIFDAQADHFRESFASVLEHGVASGRLTRVGGRYALVSPALPRIARRWRWHFLRSKLRATLRWFKHIVTFANWLPYVTRKVERHTGREIRLTLLERRLPLIFLWPRVVRVLSTRPERAVRRRDPADGGDGADGGYPVDREGA